MPAGVITVRNRSIDLWSGPGQLVRDSGIIFDLDGFDTATKTVYTEALIPNSSLGSAYETGANMYLVGISPEKQPDGYLTTLTYKGLYGRGIGPELPSLTSQNVKISTSVSLLTKQWGVGEVTGTINGKALTGYTVNVAQPVKTKKVSWVSTTGIPDRVFDFNETSGKATGLATWGNIPSSVYTWLAKPVLNVPWGWVVVDSSSEQITPGVALFLNSITARGIPEITAG